MTVLVPVWLLWALGIVAGLAVLLLAALGVVFLFAVRDFNRAWSRAWGWW